MQWLVYVADYYCSSLTEGSAIGQCEQKRNGPLRYSCGHWDIELNPSISLIHLVGHRGKPNGDIYSKEIVMLNKPNWEKGTGHTFPICGYLA